MWPDYIKDPSYRFTKCGIYLQDNTEEWGGGIDILPGSHLFGLGGSPYNPVNVAARLQVLLGYEVMPPFMGHVTASHPRKVLQPGYVNALIADDQLCAAAAPPATLRRSPD